MTRPAVRDPGTLGMTRWALLLEYDGAGFVGWQRQANGVSVQASMHKARSRISRFPTATSRARCAMR